MARRSTRPGEYHTPRQIRDAAPELAIDEIGQPAGGETERRKRRNEVHESQVIDALAPRDESQGEDYAEQSAVERHATCQMAKISSGSAA